MWLDNGVKCALPVNGGPDDTVKCALPVTVAPMTR